MTNTNISNGPVSLTCSGSDQYIVGTIQIPQESACRIDVVVTAVDEEDRVTASSFLRSCIAVSERGNVFISNDRSGDSEIRLGRAEDDVEFDVDGSEIRVVFTANDGPAIVTTNLKLLQEVPADAPQAVPFDGR